MKKEIIFTKKNPLQDALNKKKPVVEIKKKPAAEPHMAPLNTIA